LAALDEMTRDPQRGDTHGLQHSDLPAFRRRVGSYRILFDLYPRQGLVDIIDIHAAPQPLIANDERAAQRTRTSFVAPPG
jgi:hypothetical protein